MMSHEDRLTRIASSSNKVATDQLLPGWAVLSQGRGLSRGASAQEQSPGHHWLCSSVVSSHIATQRGAQRDVCQEA